jgi:hypothetical protein
MPLYGAIKDRWVSLGAERSYLGLPVGEEVGFPEGGRAVEFQNGGIYWWPDVGAIDLRDVIVHYTGLYCGRETVWDQGSGSDEPYVIISVTTPKAAATFTTQTYSSVDSGGARPDVLEIYRGRPYGINILSVVMESDFGDKNKYKQEVEKVVAGVHAAGTAALGLIPVVGPIVALVAGPALGSLMPAISDSANNLFNWGDDRINGSTTTLSARQMVLLAARTNNTVHENIGFKAQSAPLIGQGARYHVYYGLIPA